MSITGQNNAQVAEYADNAVWTALYGTTLPTAPPGLPGSPTMPTGWSIFGHLSSDGITGDRSTQQTKEFSSTGAKVFDGYSQLEESYTVVCDESNPVVENLKNPNATQTASAGTAEVQTLTVTGTPTAGSYNLSFNGGVATVQYNATASAIQTAVRTLPGLSAVTVTGTGPFTIMYPTALGNVATIGVDNSALVGGTVAASETTPGVSPVNKWVKTSSGILTPQLRLFAVGAVKLAAPAFAELGIFVGKAIPTNMGAINKGTIRKTTFRIDKFEDPTLGVETILSTNPAHAPGAFV